MASYDRNPFTGQPQFNSFATGTKSYGAGQVNAATSGRLASDGYAERERKARERRLALQRRLMMNSGQYTGPQEGI